MPQSRFLKKKVTWVPINEGFIGLYTHPTPTLIPKLNIVAGAMFYLFDRHQDDRFLYGVRCSHQRLNQMVYGLQHKHNKLNELLLAYTEMFKID